MAVRAGYYKLLKILLEVVIALDPFADDQLNCVNSTFAAIVDELFFNHRATPDYNPPVIDSA